MSYSEASPSVSAQRYRRIELLGQGGICEVHRAVDETSGREVALKQLLASTRAGSDDNARALLEAEYHTLSQLQHPSIIEVYDYGVDEEDGPYYTMELLSGSDLQALAPLPWLEVCRLLMDVASSLAVLHSRGLLHRDVTARNVRRTAEGRAKLLDFGAMTEMGLPRNTVGTPVYMPPEAVHRQSLDGRSDLYSLGALAYMLITGHFAYRATRIHQLKDQWRTPPRPPRAILRDVPANLSALIMSMLQLDPLSRPQSAAEVMMRLRSIAGLPADEDVMVQHAYLTAPKLTAREDVLLRIRKQLIRGVRGRGGVLMIEAEAGLGRSRVLDATVLEGQLAGAVVARADKRDGGRPFGAVRRLVLSLLEEKPALRELIERLELSPLLAASGDEARDGKRSVALGQFTSFLLEAAERHALLLAIDDLPQVDEPSIAVLAGIARELGARRVVLALSADSAWLQAPGLALRVLLESARRVPLSALESDQTRTLLASVFGVIPNLELLASVVQQHCHGNPRDVMSAAQRLVDRGIARYENGRWFLTDEAAKITDCVAHAEAVSERVAQLSAGARRLLSLLALDRDAKLATADYAAAFSAEPRASQVHEALTELIRTHWIVRTDDGHRFNRVSDQRGVVDGLEPAERRQLHAILAECLREKPIAPIYEAYHLVEAGSASQAHAAMRRQMEIEASRPTRVRDAIELETTERMVAAGVREGWPLPLLTQYRTFCCWLAAVSGAYERVQPLAAATLDALAQYGGLHDYQALAELPNPQRLQQALARAQARYAATPAEHQPLTPVAALGALTRVGALSATCGYLMAEPSLFDVIPSLAPLAPLSPAFGFADRLIGAFRSLTYGQLWAGWDELRKIHEDVATLSDAQLERHNRYALELASLSGLCSFDAKYATTTAPARCAALARMQPDQAENYRMLHHLARGQLREAELARKHGELLSLRAGATDDTRITRLLTHMVLYPLIEDLMGLKQTVEGLDEVVQKRPGWRYRRDYTRARELRCHGQWAAALRLIERSLEALPEAHFDWCPTVEEHVLLLTQLGRAEEAVARGAHYARRAQQLGVPTAWLDFALALALSKAGHHLEAKLKWQEAYDALRARDIGGIHIGYAHEVGARLARARDDDAEFVLHADACAEIYLAGGYPALAAKHARLLESARAGASLPVSGAPTADAASTASGLSVVHTAALRACKSSEELAQCALTLVCQHSGAQHGALFGMRGGRLQPMAADMAIEQDMAYLANAYLNAELEASSEATLTEIDAYEGTSSSEHSMRYVPIVLRTSQGQDELIVGIAMLLASLSGVRAADSTFIASLSDDLLRSGVFEGVRAAI